LIGIDGEQEGVVQIDRALEMAAEVGADLVEIASTATPPVCKIMDYGKFLYQQAKKDKEAKSKQHTITVKGIRLTPKISGHDLETKAGHARGFIKDGNKVKVFVIFRGRMITHKELGVGILERFMELLADVTSVEQTPKMEGPRNMTILLAPKRGNK
jgi:translation initiation factor IF-3